MDFGNTIVLPVSQVLNESTVCEIAKADFGLIGRDVPSRCFYRLVERIS